MAAFQIYLSQVIAEYRASGMDAKSPFVSISYRKADGYAGEKHQVRRRAGEMTASVKSDLASVQHQNRQAGKLYLVDHTGHNFELHIPLLVRWRGLLIDHRF